MQQPVLFLLKRTLLGGGVSPWMPGLRQGFLDTPNPPCWYINPGSGSGANTGKSWADAFNSATTAWADAIAASAAGDDFYVNSASTCSNSSGQTLTFKGTVAKPNRIFSCSVLTNSPPTIGDLAAGAAFTVTGNSAIALDGSFYVYGVTFNQGTGAAGSPGISIGTNAGADQTFDTCQLKLLITTNTCLLTLGINNANNRVKFINTSVAFNGGVNSGFAMNNVHFVWQNTPSAIQGAQNAIANLFQAQATRLAFMFFDGVDFIGTTGIASGKNIIGASAQINISQFVDCKVNAGVLVARPTTPGCFIDQIVTDSGATGYKQQRDTYQGTLLADPLRYNNASDGTTPISWQVTTTANASPPSPFECFAISQWVPAGTYAASKIFLTSTNAGLLTTDVWVEFDYLGSNYALGSAGTTFGAGSGLGGLSLLPAGTKGTLLAAASPAWAVGSLGSDYQLVIPSFTTSAPGLVRFFVKIGKPSVLVNVDPAAKVA